MKKEGKNNRLKDKMERLGLEILVKLLLVMVFVVWGLTVLPLIMLIIKLIF